MRRSSRLRLMLDEWQSLISNVSLAKSLTWQRAEEKMLLQVGQVKKAIEAALKIWCACCSGLGLAAETVEAFVPPPVLVFAVAAALLSLVAVAANAVQPDPAAASLCL